MKITSNGVVLLGSEEARVLADILRMARSLCEDLEAKESPGPTLEADLLYKLDHLEELGVSPEELVESSGPPSQA